MVNCVDPDQFWIHAVCFYTKFVSNVSQLFAADNFSRRHFQMHFFLGALRINMSYIEKYGTIPAVVLLYINSGNNLA